MKTVMNVDSSQVDSLLGIALLIGTPFFIVFGWLSDKVGRKYIMMSGMLLAILFYRPIYKMMYNTTDVNYKTEIVERTTQNTETANNNDVITTVSKTYTDGTMYIEHKTDFANKKKSQSSVIININSGDEWTLIFLVFIQVIFVTMVYGPIAAFLVEMFPTKIRYTSMSLPYHVGNGIFGGLLPAISTYFVTHAKAAGKSDFYLDGLWYPIIIASICFVIGMIYIDNKNKINHL
jgi:MFS family permease